MFGATEDKVETALIIALSLAKDDNGAKIKKYKISLFTCGVTDKFVLRCDSYEIHL